jgi:excisionase family DNA binding protein
MRPPPEPLTIDDLRRRPTITVQEYARFVGVSKDTVYEAASRGELRVLHLGRRVLVPTAPVLAELGYAVDGAGCSGCRE